MNCIPAHISWAFAPSCEIPRGLPNPVCLGDLLQSAYIFVVPENRIRLKGHQAWIQRIIHLSWQPIWDTEKNLDYFKRHGGLRAERLCKLIFASKLGANIYSYIPYRQYIFPFPSAYISGVGWDYLWRCLRRYASMAFVCSWMRLAAAVMFLWSWARVFEIGKWSDE